MTISNRTCRSIIVQTLGTSLISHCRMSCHPQISSHVILHLITSLIPLLFTFIIRSFHSIFQCPVIPSPSPSRSISPPKRISRVYNPSVAKVLIHRQVLNPPHAPSTPRIQVHDPPVDAAGVIVERRRLVYVAIRIMGEKTMKMFINLEDWESVYIGRIR